MIIIAMGQPCEAHISTKKILAFLEQNRMQPNKQWSQKLNVWEKKKQQILPSELHHSRMDIIFSRWTTPFLFLLSISGSTHFQPPLEIIVDKQNLHPRRDFSYCMWKECQWPVYFSFANCHSLEKRKAGTALGSSFSSLLKTIFCIFPLKGTLLQIATAQCSMNSPGLSQGRIAVTETFTML